MNIVLLVFACSAPEITDGDPPPATDTDTTDTDTTPDTDVPVDTDPTDTDPDTDTGAPVDTGPLDGDGDGWFAAEDCDDADDTIHPEAAEVCEDGVDQNCIGGDPACHPAIVSQDLDGSSYPRFDGWLGGQQTGWSVDVPGDVDGDGVADLLIAARVSVNGPSGPVMVVPGGNLVSGVLSTSAVSFMMGANNDSLGWAVAGAGDVDGDGLANVVCGLPFVDSRALVLQPVAGITDIDATYLAKWEGLDDDDNTGLDVAGGFDLTGDSVLDLAVGASAAVYVVDASLAGDFVVDAATTRIVDGDSLTTFGARVDVGDVDGDGVADLLVGDTSAKVNDDLGVGQALLFSGPIPAGVLDANVAATLVVEGKGEGWLLGYDVAVAGDLDGDGTDDWIAAAREGNLNDASPATEGHAYVLSGSLTGTVTTDAAFASWIGDDPDGDVLRVEGPDLDGNGVAELALAANDGEVHVTFGPLLGVYGPADSVTLGIIELNNGELGSGDLDADGFTDLVIGSAEAGTYGTVWVVWGAQ